MSLDQFLKKPLTETHPAYKSSFLQMTPAPEYSNGEVVLASTYRSIGSGLCSVPESDVPKNGRDFYSLLNKGKGPINAEQSTGISTNDWLQIVDGTLRSPKQPNQAAKKFLQISPVVPDTALYSSSARLAANSWNPGALVARMIQFGSASDAEAQEIWEKLFNALKVDDSDDLWARYLNQEFKAWRNPANLNFFEECSKLAPDEAVTSWRSDSERIPAKQFVSDLHSIIDLKSSLTRRQWTSMLEALLRIGTTSHTIWVAKTNIRLFQALRKTLEGKPLTTAFTLLREPDSGNETFKYGAPSAPVIREISTGFVKAKLGINLLMFTLQDKLGEKLIADCLKNSKSIESLITLVADLDTTEKLDTLGRYELALDLDSQLMAGKKGPPSNISEFLRHVLGQRQTSETGLDSYDQGYFLIKKGSYSSAPWIVSMGPVSILTLVHACTHVSRGSKNVEDLRAHLLRYGIGFKTSEVENTSLGKAMRNLGLVLDSPDAEGGMVLISPFESTIK